MLESIPVKSDRQTKTRQYSDAFDRIQALLQSETDWVAGMATLVAELHNSFEYFHWTGFYRVVAPGQLKIGPYQGGHGCLDIAFERGVCGAAARTGKTQLVPDVELFEGHIACSSSARSEIVVPVFNSQRQLLAVFDVDSNDPDAFDATDQAELEKILKYFGERFSELKPLPLRHF